ncbi:unnamed protein product [Caenorhabditis bovis]|uniref:Uncharacterized protein n=1 Tax=Caenorhabditis bovis TaxID=2654633 RepID=A0A8S1ERE1_9PELO|nr:unnamed protein product [Caenorhabditis bovis]
MFRQAGFFYKLFRSYPIRSDPNLPPSPIFFRAGLPTTKRYMDWIYSWKDSIFYGMCSCSGPQHDATNHFDKLDMPLQLKAYRSVD